MPSIPTFSSFSLVLLLLAGAAAAKGKDADDELLSHGEELSGELRGAEKSSLEAVLGRSEREASSSVSNARAILRDASLELSVSSRECPDPGQREELSTSAGVLAAKTEGFRLKSASASLRWEDLDAEALSTLRADYRPKDRARDLFKLKSSLSKLSAARSAPKPSSVEEGAVDALRDCAAELRAALAPLHAAAKTAPRSRMGERAERLEEDADALGVEADILSVSLRLKRIDEDSFEEKED